jgi:hypothetical protein
VGTNQYLSNKIEFSQIVEILNFCLKERNLSEISKFCLNKSIDQDILEKLISAKLLTSNEEIFEKQENINFKNNLYLDLVANSGEKVHNKLQKTKFIIIGCGGIGNFISYALTTFSVKELILLDGDIIEEGNLNRQFLFRRKDLGEYKVDILERELKEINPSVQITKYRKFADQEVLEGLLKNNCGETIGVLSGDSDNLVSQVSAVFSKFKLPFINVGYMNDISIVEPFLVSQKTSCPNCRYNQLDNENYFVENNHINELVCKINSQYTAPSSFVNNALASSQAISEIIKFIDGDYQRMNTFNTRFGINNITFEKYSIPIEKSEQCSCSPAKVNLQN